MSGIPQMAAPERLPCAIPEREARLQEPEPARRIAERRCFGLAPRVWVTFERSRSIIDALRLLCCRRSYSSGSRASRSASLTSS
jgi:hypothetical protein